MKPRRTPHAPGCDGLLRAPEAQARAAMRPGRRRAPLPARQMCLLVGLLPTRSSAPAARTSARSHPILSQHWPRYGSYTAPRCGYGGRGGMHARRRGAEARVQRWALRKQQTSPAAAAAAVQGRAERDSRHMWRREIRLGVICDGVCSDKGQKRAGGAARGAQAQENAHVRWPQGWGSPPDGMHPSLSGAPRASSTPPIRVLGAVEQPAGDANTTEEHRGVPAPRAGQTARRQGGSCARLPGVVLPAACMCGRAAHSLGLSGTPSRARSPRETAVCAFSERPAAQRLWVAGRRGRVSAG